MGWPDEEGGLPSRLASGTISSTAALHTSPQANHLPSMLLDYRNASPIEVEVIFGEVVRMARERNVPLPVSFNWRTLWSIRWIDALLAHRDIVCAVDRGTEPDPWRIQDANESITVTCSLDGRCCVRMGIVEPV